LREFYIQSGIYQGHHNIFDTVDEFKKIMPDTPYYRWGREENIYVIKPNVWVESLDGYIVQCLSVKMYNSSVKGKKDGETLMCRFPMVTVRVTRKNSGKTYWQKLYAQFTPSNQYTMSGTNKNGKRVKYMESLFASLVGSGVSPYNAFIQAGFRYTPSHNSLKNKIAGLLMKEEIQQQIQKSLQPYIEKIKSDPEFSDENMVEYVKDFMRHVKKGSQTHLNSLIPLLKLLGKLPQDFDGSNTKTKMKRDAQEVPYEDVPPP
jgi:hypothetical protein